MFRIGDNVKVCIMFCNNQFEYVHAWNRISNVTFIPWTHCSIPSNISPKSHKYGSSIPDFPKYITYIPAILRTAAGIWLYPAYSMTPISYSDSAGSALLPNPEETLKTLFYEPSSHNVAMSLPMTLGATNQTGPGLVIHALPQKFYCKDSSPNAQARRVRRLLTWKIKWAGTIQDSQVPLSPVNIFTIRASRNILSLYGYHS